jgi:hypothetical protein
MARSRVAAGLNDRRLKMLVEGTHLSRHRRGVHRGLDGSAAAMAEHEQRVDT